MWWDELYLGFRTTSWKKIAQQLLAASFKTWDNKLIATEFTLPAKVLYEKTNHFAEMKILNGVRLYLRSDLKYILNKKGGWLQKLKPFWTIADSIINFVGDIRFRNIPALPNNFQVNIGNEISEEASAFINKQNQYNLFQRNADALQWMLQYPWIIRPHEGDDQTSRYHFTATDKSFDFIPVEVKDIEGNICAFILFAKRSNNLTLPYCFFTCNADIVVSIIQHYMKVLAINTFTVYHASIAEKLKQQPMQVLWKKEVKRSYFISKELFQQLTLKELHLQDGDGDCAFT
ncbi:MAG: hypothetical protein IPG60_06200 [Bacteroidetes bacterium]|nr:hypothetical protein [Bacteroidota bacterium]